MQLNLRETLSFLSRDKHIGKAIASKRFLKHLNLATFICLFICMQVKAKGLALEENIQANYTSNASVEEQRVITGQVTDASNGAALPGVAIIVKGTTNGTLTDVDGNFKISVPEDAILVFSYVGYVTEAVSVTGRSQITVSLIPDITELNEVVVIGYGTAKKKDLTGSISTVEGEKLAKSNTTQLSEALQGTMPGVRVTRSSDEPGASAGIRIRGITTMSDNTPLFIVDGVPVSDINYIDANNVESITVLKDAASASIYGARAAAGVILITTKRADAGQLELEYSANFGIDKPTEFVEKVGPQRYLDMINEWVWNDAGNPPGGEYALYTKDEVDNWLAYNQTNPDQYPITNWKELLLDDHAFRQSHNLAITAGGEHIKTRASINYEDVGALYDHRSFKRILSRVNNSIAITDYLSADVDLSHNYTHNTEPIYNPVWGALAYAPIYAATWEDGRIAGGKNGDNAYAKSLYGGFQDYWVNNLNARISIDFKPTKDLTFTGRIAPNLYFKKFKNFRKQIKYYAADDPTRFEGYISGYHATNLSEERNDGYNITKQFLANYTKALTGGHNVTALLGYEDYFSSNEKLGGVGREFELSNYPYLNLAPLDNISVSGYAFENAYRSFFGRLTYNFKNKYFIQGNLRFDGSSRFHPDYRWGYFPSISGGWAISEEKFMENIPVISFLKLRGSWGTVGNERIGNYPYQSNINFNNGLFYRGDQIVSAITAAQVDYAIRDITWEDTETFDIGLDLNLFKNKLALTADYYKKTTKGMLLELEIPDYMGFENPQQNAGKMYTEGWDMNLSWRDQLGELNYSVSLNVSDAKTLMGDLGGIVFDGSKIIREGSEYNEWYGYVSDGIFQTQEEVDNSPVLSSSVKPGDIKYLDISGPEGKPDGLISPDYDRVLLGGSLPRYVYGGAISVDYKGFDLTVAFQGVGKQNSYLDSRLMIPFQDGWENPSAIIDGNYWSHYNTPEENLQVDYPRLSVLGEDANYATSDFWLINGAYFRLQNVVLGYTLPKAFSNRIKLKNIRVYGSVSDAFSIDHFPKGWDPEAAYNSFINKTFNLGISVKF